jgi:signal transduction histidine kinase/HPt (histidine-containing phosphotransfer) domain-containing protein/AmiR/NasT family two-component response regulator
MKLKQTSIVFSFAALFILIANAFFIVQVYRSHSLSIETQKHRQDAMSLVHDLRLQTNQLSRLVRTYTTTGEPRYLLYYYYILSIRQGEKPVPEGYNSSTYWDRVIAGEIVHQMPKSGNRQSLSEQMRALGFTSDEMDILKNIFTITESMKHIEQIAFAATQGLYDPDTQEFVDDGKPQLEFAIRMVHSEEYNKLTAALSMAVEKLTEITDRRTDMDVRNADTSLKYWILLSILTMICTIVMVIISLYVIRRQVLQPIDRLDIIAGNMARGDYAARMSLNTGVEEFVSLSRTFNSMAQAIEDDIYTRQKIQNDLEEANRKAEEATRAKSMFLANMSHEIRTPMNAIIGMAYLVLRTDLTAYQKDHISKIHTAAQSLLGIINDILDFSKVEAGKLELEQTAFSLKNVLENSMTLLAPRAREKGVELLSDYTEFPEKGNTLVGDGLRLGQIITNMLSNAVKFTHQGYVRLGARIAAQSDDMMILHVMIEDTGIGMTQEQLSSLFKEFTQADGSTTRKYGGTGLGLVISKKLAELMGGRIRVESVIDKGTVFHLEIPFAIAPPDASDADSSNKESAEAINLSGMRVLLVEDNSINQQLAVELMYIHGVHTDIANNGMEAIQKLESVAPDYYDLVLMDIQMPVMDGYEATGQLRADARYDNLPIAAMTAHAMQEEREKCRRVGMNDHINKPIEPELLYRLLERYYHVRNAKCKMQNDIPAPIPQTADSASSELPIIEGVDAGNALRRIGGRIEFYRKLLKQFVEEYRSGAEVLSFEIESENWQTAERQAHTLKGLFGTIGAENLQAISADMEKALKNQDVEAVKQTLAVLKQPFAKLISDIAKALETPIPAPNPPENKERSSFGETDTSWIPEFRDLLGKFDLNAVKIWEEKQSLLSGVLTAQTINSITNAIDELEYDVALNLLHEYLPEKN